MASSPSARDRLGQPGAILLCSLYELGHQPHGLAMPAAFLERAGYRPRCVDLSIDPLTDEAIDRAELAVIAVPMHTALRLGARLAERIRARNPRCVLCFTGLYAAMNATYLRTLGATHVLAGESEQALLEVLDHGTAEPAERTVLEKLNFPRPSRAALPALDRYAHLEDATGRHRVVGYVEATRGCLDTCRHCPVPVVYGGRFFVVPRQVVLDDIAQLVEAGAEHITFGDPDFLNGPGHAFAITHELHQRWPDLSFDITAQITHLLRHRDRLGELVEQGCAFVVSAVESLSDDVLGRLRKRHRRADFEQALAACRAAALVMRPTFVAFTPWTTLEDTRALVELIQREGLEAAVDPIQLTIRLLVPPGSLLTGELRRDGLLGELDPGALTHTWDHPDPRLDRLQHQLTETVERAVESGEPDQATHAMLRRLVWAATGDEPPASALVPRPRQRVPRLSEPWFC
jgi:radical SAM superfamily enzyme YgiQ (UPF0313 family)